MTNQTSHIPDQIAYVLPVVDGGFARDQPTGILIKIGTRGSTGLPRLMTLLITPIGKTTSGPDSKKASLLERLCIRIPQEVGRLLMSDQLP